MFQILLSMLTSSMFFKSAQNEEKFRLVIDKEHPNLAAPLNFHMKPQTKWVKYFLLLRLTTSKGKKSGGCSTSLHSVNINLVFSSPVDCWSYHSFRTESETWLDLYRECCSRHMMIPQMKSNTIAPATLFTAMET